MNDLFKFFESKRILITGHTGFKGSWLCSILNIFNSKICGVALNQEKLSHFEILKNHLPIDHNIINILDYSELEKKIFDFNPDIIIHLAAQPFVRLSYEQPIQTISTNIVGTSNILNIARKIRKKPFVAIITSDKCYENKETNMPYKESDRMGGYDVYSASKGASELIVTSFAKSFYIPNKQKVIALRAGNVIGGGDWGKERLFTDIINSLSNKKNPVLRNPKSVRPWQHVLDVLSGYLSAIVYHYNNENTYYENFNIGPHQTNIIKVINVAKIAVKKWDKNYGLDIKENNDLHEAKLLSLNIDKALTLLQWKPQLDIFTSIDKTIDWYKKWYNNCDMNSYTNSQIKDYFNNFEIS